MHTKRSLRTSVATSDAMVARLHYAVRVYVYMDMRIYSICRVLRTVHM